MAPPGEPIDLSGPLAWHILVTARAQENTVMAELKDLGLDPYLPVLHKVIPAGRRRKREISLPMFTGRLFVPMPPSAWGHVLSLRGVHDFDRFGGSERPAVVNDEAIAIVRRIEQRRLEKFRRKHAAKPECDDGQRYEKGQRVWATLLPPPFDKLLGTIADIDERGRIEVLLEEEVFGRRCWPLAPAKLMPAVA
jgi:transcription antitermination factor NusG